MKYCSRVFDYVYLDHFNGDVWICQWMEQDRKYIIGNILEQNFADIWNGKKAEQVRDMFRQGDFSKCRFEACPWLQNDELQNIEGEKWNELTKTAPYPKKINLEKVESLNTILLLLLCKTETLEKFHLL